MSQCKVDYLNAYVAFYQFYLKMIEKYDDVDNMEYIDRERLLHLGNESVNQRMKLQKAIRAYYNFKAIVKDEYIDSVSSNYEVH